MVTANSVGNAVAADMMEASACGGLGPSEH
jgi:hypothetical protein